MNNYSFDFYFIILFATIGLLYNTQYCYYFNIYFDIFPKTILPIHLYFFSVFLGTIIYQPK